MKSIYLTAGKTQDVFNDLKDNFNGTLIVNNDEYNLALKADFARGIIKGITFPDGMTYMEFNVIFYEDVRLSMESFTNSPIFFAYCSQGSLTHSFGEQGERKRIKENYSGILKSAARVNSILHFDKQVPIKFSVISIGTNTVVNEENAELINKLKHTFFHIKEDYLDIKVQDAKIANKINELTTLTQKGIVGNLLKNRILENILEMEIAQHTDGFTEIGQAINVFTTKRIDEIKKASDFVMNIPAEVGAKFLAVKTAMSSNKLHEGFKTLSNRTLHDFLIFMKIERQRI
ncbi:MAG: hypothetical protein V4572_01060 [Bacteroidota bacterium]